MALYLERPSYVREYGVCTLDYPSPSLLVFSQASRLPYHRWVPSHMLYRVRAGDRYCRAEPYMHPRLMEPRGDGMSAARGRGDLQNSASLTPSLRNMSVSYSVRLEGRHASSSAGGERSLGFLESGACYFVLPMQLAVVLIGPSRSCRGHIMGSCKGQQREGERSRSRKVNH